MIPISDLRGLISLQDAWVVHEDWFMFFNVRNASRLAELSMRSSSERSFFVGRGDAVSYMLVRLFVVTVIFKDL